MTKHPKILIVGLAVVALAAGGAGMTVATGEDDSAEQVSGPGADRARNAALEITGGGDVRSVELDSENGATWEVEVAKPDGSEVDVRLDDNYDLVVVEDDTEASDDVEEADGSK